MMGDEVACSSIALHFEGHMEKEELPSGACALSPMQGAPISSYLRLSVPCDDVRGTRKKAIAIYIRGLAKADQWMAVSRSKGGRGLFGL
jgi:hypothetical protein